MSDGPVKGWVGQVRQVVLTLLLVAAGVRIAWALLAPAVPILVSLVVVLVVLSVAVFGPRSTK
jgi:hypothetical protein